jgi:hypothetical protein
MEPTYNYLAVGVDSDGGIWLYEFSSFDEAYEFIQSVADDNWHWDVRSTTKEASVAEAVANFKHESEVF